MKCADFLKDKTRVLITHQLQFLKDSDKVVLLHEVSKHSKRENSTYYYVRISAIQTSE